MVVIVEEWAFDGVENDSHNFTACLVCTIKDRVEESLWGLL
jgi:hypothetical protein